MNIYKLLCSVIAIGLVSLTGNTQAEKPPISTTPTPQSQPVSPTSTPLKATDLPFLTRVVGKFWQTDRAETESQMEIDSSDEKGKTKYFVSVKTIAKIGRKFRAELTIDRVGNAAKIKYTIVSDGQKTWIYRPDLRQYAQIDTSDVYGNPSSSIVSLPSIFLASIEEERRQDILTDVVGENNRILSLENLKSLEIQIRQQQIDGKNLSIHTIGDDRIVKISTFVDTQTAILGRTEIKFRDGGKYTKIVEKIIKRNPEVIITSKTFTFSVPKGVKKVKSLEIGPFKF
jgi:outer membrane lipoprotein-sorting protein